MRNDKTHEISESPNTPVSVRLKQDTKDKLREIANAQRRSVSNLLQIIIEDYVEDNYCCLSSPPEKNPPKK